VSAADVARLLGRRPGAPTAEAGARAADGAELEAGLPRLLADTERHWLEEALQRYPTLTRAEIAARLKISESALYKKLRQHGLGA